MKKLLLFPALIAFFLSCTNNKEESDTTKDTKIALHTDTVNIVKLTDTLVIYESTCRGCAYEQSTHFDISDSLSIVKLFAVHTKDNNSADINGGSISKDLIIVPVKAGTTTVKLYKFLKEEITAEDSAKFIPYTIEVQN